MTLVRLYGPYKPFWDCISIWYMASVFEVHLVLQVGGSGAGFGVGLRACMPFKTQIVQLGPKSHTIPAMAFGTHIRYHSWVLGPSRQVIHVQIPFTECLGSEASETGVGEPRSPQTLTMDPERAL